MLTPTFLLWGALHGAGLAAHAAWRRFARRPRPAGAPGPLGVPRDLLAPHARLRGDELGALPAAVPMPARHPARAPRGALRVAHMSATRASTEARGPAGLRGGRPRGPRRGARRSSAPGGVGAALPLLRGGVITSIELVSVLVALERRFGVAIPVSAAPQMSLASIVRAPRGERGRGAWRRGAGPDACAG